MARGKYRGGPKRGGAKKYSQDLKPLDSEGNEIGGRPKAWRSDDEEDDEESSGGGEEPDLEQMQPSLRIGPSDDESEEEEPSKSKVKAATTADSVENPNRNQKSAISASELAKAAPREMSRREREAFEKQQAKEKYWKLHEQGKTDQARADLARLALIRKEREEKAKQRVAETELKKEEAAKRAAAQGRRK